LIKKKKKKKKNKKKNLKKKIKKKKKKKGHNSDSTLTLPNAMKFSQNQLPLLQKSKSSTDLIISQD